MIEKRKECDEDEMKENWQSGIDPNEHKESERSDYSEPDGDSVSGLQAEPA